MISDLIKLILERRIASLMFYLGVCLFGLIALKDIPLSLLPNIEFPQLTIITSFPNASAEEIESIITKPISQIVGTIQGVEKVESNSKEGNSFVYLRFKNGTDMGYAILEIREKLDLIRDVLPYEASKPLVSKFDPTKKAFLEIVFNSEALGDEKNLRGFINEQIKLYFERIDGIALVEIRGGHEKEIFVEIDPKRLRAYKIQANELPQLISSNNKNFPAGHLPFGNKDLPVRLLGEFKTKNHLENLIIQSQETSYTKLGDISKITETYKTRSGFAKYNGKEAVILSLYREPGKNTVKIAEEVGLVVNQINRTYSKEIKGVISYDESIFIKESLNGLYLNLVIGAILAYFALLIILKNFESPSILLFTIPVTLLPSFLVFRSLGIGFNMMSLGGLALGIGMLFDSSNVVLSGIERNLKTKSKLNDSILAGTMEVLPSVFSATTTTIIVFLPIGFIKSTLGIIFREMALSIIITLTFSLMTAILFIPLLASYLYKYRKTVTSNIFIFKIYQEEKIIKIFHRFLSSLIKAKTLFLSTLLLLFFLSLMLIPWLTKEYMPSIDTGVISIQIELPPGSDLDSLSQFVAYLETSLLQDRSIESILTTLGGSEENLRLNPTAVAESNEAEMILQLRESRNETTKEVVERFRNRLSKFEGVKVIFEARENVLGELLSEKKSILVFDIISDELAELAETGALLKDKLLTLSGVFWVTLGSETKASEYQINYDQSKMARFGISNSQVSTFVKLSLKGLHASDLQVNGTSIAIRLGIQKGSSDSIEKIQNLQFVAPNGESVYLGQFINISKRAVDTNIFRIANQRVNHVRIGFDEEVDQLKKEIQTLINRYAEKSEIKIRSGDENEKLGDSFREVLLSFLLALFLIFMLLSGQFESYLTSFVMLATIPLIFIGTIPALLISGKSLNISSFMGFILLLGVVVDNATLYFEYFHLFLKESTDPEKALLKATSTVLKPILMNNSTTILGMLPILFSISKGSEFQAPLGIVVVFGLLTSVILSLFVIPILFLIIEKRKSSSFVP
ncbi:efflux RND transporter permease subunit [Leptospira ognonensis]|uniref:Efflux RND transporter permease subunit n=1 Tax=Leptospira ognonensis TaxID=2484945 RepID=A0A4R9K4W1_9LEPT|nr:efflux RND transporter permease subunit [Leptospira ognonensis]TGL61192.1 efflux RND transporter permease subunit [Leptospira ognonensis]